MNQQSYMQVFVTNSPALLADGATVENIAVGQVGIVDAKTYKSTTSPTYATTKALKLVWGTPNIDSLPLLAGVPNENEYSKLIKGKNITDFKGKKAQRGQNEIWTVGFSGDPADTDTLFAKPGEVKTLYIKLTGAPIDKLYSKQGVTRQFSTVVRSSSPDCDDPCSNVDCRQLALDLVNQINADPQIGKVGTRQPLIKASTVDLCDTPATFDTETFYQFELRVCDTRDDAALGIVQAQYPDDVVKRIGFEGSLSVYQVTRDSNSRPANFSDEDITLIPDCATCPSTGYTLVASGFAYKVTRQDNGDAGALTQVETDYSISGGDESASRIHYEFGQSTYILVSTTELTQAAGDTLVFLGDIRSSCVLTTPTTIEWESGDTLTAYGKIFKITLADTTCGDSRLADLQAAYPDLTIAEVNSGTACVHSYFTEVWSDPVDNSCSLDELTWIPPSAFEGVYWVEDTTLPSEGDCLCGIRLEVAFVNRITGECTFDYFPYESDSVHIQVSNFDPDYNQSPDETAWAVKQIQAFKHPSGFGAHVRQLEKESKSYALRERSFDPVVRDVEGYSFQTDPYKYYDEYTLFFDFAYEVGGWSERYTDTYELHVFFPEGQGSAFESAINAYLASAALQIDPVIL